MFSRFLLVPRARASVSRVARIPRILTRRALPAIVAVRRFGSGTGKGKTKAVSDFHESLFAKEQIQAMQVLQSVSDALEMPVPLPTIVLFGDQSAGKTTVLEVLIGVLGFFPRGMGTATRRPTEITVLKAQETERDWIKIEPHGEPEYDMTRAPFLIAEGNKGEITEKPMRITISSKNATHSVKVVDLPGFMTSDNDNAETPKKIKRMAEPYVSDPANIKVLVMSGASDAQLSHGWKILQRLGQLSNTLMVVTKADLFMRSSTPGNLLAFLRDPKWRAGLGNVAVWLRADTESHVGLKEMEERESNLFASQGLREEPHNGVFFGIRRALEIASKEQLRRVDETLPAMRDKFRAVIESGQQEAQMLKQLRDSKDLDATATDVGRLVKHLHPAAPKCRELNDLLELKFFDRVRSTLASLSSSSSSSQSSQSSSQPSQSAQSLSSLVKNDKKAWEPVVSSTAFPAKPRTPECEPSLEYTSMFERNWRRGELQVELAPEELQDVKRVARSQGVLAEHIEISHVGVGHTRERAQWMEDLQSLVSSLLHPDRQFAKGIVALTQTTIRDFILTSLPGENKVAAGFLAHICDDMTRRVDVAALAVTLEHMVRREARPEADLTRLLAHLYRQLRERVPEAWPVSQKVPWHARVPYFGEPPKHPYPLVIAQYGPEVFEAYSRGVLVDRLTSDIYRTMAALFLDPIIEHAIRSAMHTITNRGYFKDKEELVGRKLVELRAKLKELDDLIDRKPHMTHKKNNK